MIIHMGIRSTDGLEAMILAFLDSGIMDSGCNRGQLWKRASGVSGCLPIDC